jgi:hypothetical protein
VYNYLAMAVAATVGIVFFDDDPSAVSTQEWVLYAVLLYAAFGFFRRLLEIAKNNHPD